MPDVPSPEESPDMGEMFRKRSPDNADEWLRGVGGAGAAPGTCRVATTSLDERPSQSRLGLGAQWHAVRRPAGPPSGVHLCQRHDPARLHAGAARHARLPPEDAVGVPRPHDLVPPRLRAGRVAALRPGVPVGVRRSRPGHRPGKFSADGVLVATVAQEARSGTAADPAAVARPSRGCRSADRGPRTRRLRSHGVWCTVITPPVPSTV